jgi:hypothetical protein
LGEEPNGVVAQDISQSSLNLTPRPNKVKRGTGAESKARMPDRYDNYPFESQSLAYWRILLLGYSGIHLSDLVRLGNVLEQSMEAQGTTLTPRNRAAHRRMPNAFHWLDENLAVIPVALYDRAVVGVLGTVRVMRTMVIRWPV